MIIKESDYLMHYGIRRRSGRYPWGSGGTVVQRSKSFMDIVNDLKRQGMSEAEIAKGFSTPEHKFTTDDLRALNSIARHQFKQDQIRQAQRHKEKGRSNSEIGRRMGLNESSVRALLEPGAKDKLDILQTTANVLKKHVDANPPFGLIDIGSGTENHIGVSKTKLGVAVAMLKEEGYTVHNVKIAQRGTGKLTEYKLLCAPGVTQKQAWQNSNGIKTVAAFSEDGGRSFLGLQPPISIKSKRISVRYAEDGGAQADGVIYVRPGVKDISLGAARYAQVRIAVDGTHFLKGMAVYKDDLPDGVDLVFNTNKKDTGNKLDAMKLQKDDEDNPFGATLRQIIGPNGKVTSAMNIVGSESKPGSGEEGSWETWSKSLSRQFLSKQSPDLAKNQLNMTFEKRHKELDEILSLTNPTVRKKMLETFADDVDKAAVDLKAHYIPRQGSHVILPVNSMKPNEIYAPKFENGERVALIRYPHAGTFEIPELTVNNRNKEARALLGTGPKMDAVGIHHSVAERLSGADFDGDAVLVIPNNKKLVKTTPALEGLRGFDPQVYKIPEGSPIPTIKTATKHNEMGTITNLISDMTIRGASTPEIARAVRHSMVVIDAEKHNLDHKASFIDNGIPALQQKYQKPYTKSGKAAASTLITRATSQQDVPERVPRSAAKGGPVDKTTGKKVFEETGRTYVDRKTGKTVFSRTPSKKLAETDDAHTLSSGLLMENIYAEHSNRLKSMANVARKEAVHTKANPYSPSAKVTYSNEVASLNAKLNIALKNRPLERQAQVLAKAHVESRRQANPHMDKDDLKKLNFQALTEARRRVGVEKQDIKIEPKEWEAIQAGAISSSKLNDILKKADLEVVKKLALPRQELLMTSTKKARAQAMINSGYTQAEIARQLGVSMTTLKTSISS